MSILIYFATIFWSLFPNLIHVFQGGENQVIKVDETNLVENGDLTLDSNGVPDGFTSTSTNTNISLVDGIFTFTPQVAYGGISTINSNSLIIGDIYYQFAYVKGLTNNTRMIIFSPEINILHSGNGQYQLLSSINEKTGLDNKISITSNVVNNNPISVDYIGAYNVSTMINNGIKNDEGILFSDLSNEEIKLQLDKWINDYGDLTYKIDNTYDKWFNTGFVEKTAERDFIDYLGYFFWLMTPPIILFATLDLIRRVI